MQKQAFTARHYRPNYLSQNRSFCCSQETAPSSYKKEKLTFAYFMGACRLCYRLWLRCLKWWSLCIWYRRCRCRRSRCRLWGCLLSCHLYRHCRWNPWTAMMCRRLWIETALWFWRSRCLNLLSFLCELEYLLCKMSGNSPTLSIG